MPSLLAPDGSRISWDQLLERNERYWQTHDREGNLIPPVAPPRFIGPSESCADCKAGYHNGCSGRRKLRRGARESYPCECAELNHGRGQDEALGRALLHAGPRSRLAARAWGTSAATAAKRGERA